MSKKLELVFRTTVRDRWFPYDRMPRSFFRRLIRGKSRPTGQAQIVGNLVKGLDRIGVTATVTSRLDPSRRETSPLGVIGQAELIQVLETERPKLFGTATFSHPLGFGDLLERYNVKRVLVPGPWMRQMFAPYFGDLVYAWPSGIDTEQWSPAGLVLKQRALLYIKPLWDREGEVSKLAASIIQIMEAAGFKVEVLKYGSYYPEELLALSRVCRFGVYLCEHETQGLAYQQMLSCGLPLLAWDQGGFWLDPEFYPRHVSFAPVSSVPYWSDGCGEKFRNLRQFSEAMDRLIFGMDRNDYDPRDFVVSQLSLERSAAEYLAHMRAIGW